MEFNEIYERICAEINVSLAPNSQEADKAFVGLVEGIIFGVLFNTVQQSWKYPEEKRLRMLHDILDILEQESITLSILESINGKIQDFSMLFPLGRFHKYHILKAVNSNEDKSVQFILTTEIKGELIFWSAMLRINQLGFPLPSLDVFPPLQF